MPADEALVNQLNAKYADKVIPDVGLGVCVFDLIEASEGKIRYGDGCYWHKGALPVTGWIGKAESRLKLLLGLLCSVLSSPR